EPDAGQIPARPSEAGNEANSHRVITGHEDDGDRRRCRLGWEYRRSTGRSDYGNLTTNQISCQRLQPLVLALGPAVFDRHVLALDEARVCQALAERPQSFRDRIGRSGVQIPDHRHRRLLRPRRERPDRRAAEQRDELPTLHSITSSASAKSFGENWIPSALAVFRL